VSEICLGTMTFGVQCDERTSFAILDRAIEGGVDFIDTADVYPLGGTLETVGRTEDASAAIVTASCWRPSAQQRWGRVPTMWDCRGSTS
jgi:aryl-alcohol dehydrogenase-like predicted oxidoreductase